MKVREVNLRYEVVIVWEIIRLDIGFSIIGWEMWYCVS